MDAFTYTVDTSALDERIEKINALNTVAFWETIGASIKSLVNLGFKFGRDPWGNPWAPVKFRTRNGKLVPGPYQPLRDTGRMQRSIFSIADTSGVTVGLNIKSKDGKSIGAVHQFGATITAKKGPFLVFDGPNGLIRTHSVTIPARPFLPIKSPSGPVELPPLWSQAIVGRIKAYLFQQMNAA